VALLFDASGRLVGSYAKLHLPDEEGFHEPAHYEPGTEPPAVLDLAGMPVGVQICSDSNRPEGSHLLGALGAEVILAPRATEAATWERWKLVLRVNAMTSGAFIVSVNRPTPEFGVPLGGPSIAISPDGEVLLETPAPLAVVDLDRGAIAAARKRYPGYLTVRADLYARAWSAVAASSSAARLE
jgi:N-carbamoylputrescine amidase